MLIQRALEPKYMGNIARLVIFGNPIVKFLQKQHILGKQAR